MPDASFDERLALLEGRSTPPPLKDPPMSEFARRKWEYDERKRQQRFADAAAEERRQAAERQAAADRRQAAWAANAPRRERAERELDQLEPELQRARAELHQLEAHAARLEAVAREYAP